MTTYDILTFFLKLFIVSNLVVAGVHVIHTLSRHKGNWITNRKDQPWNGS